MTDSNDPVVPPVPADQPKKRGPKKTKPPKEPALNPLQQFYRDRANADAKVDVNAPLMVMTCQCAQFFAVNEQTLIGWGRRGCPKAARGCWDVKKVFDWWKDNVLDLEGKSRRAEQVKVDYVLTQTRHKQILIDREMGTLVPRADIVDLWTQRALEVKTGAIALASRLPGLLYGLDQLSMKRVIREEVRLLLEAYSTVTENTPPTGVDFDEDE